MNWATMLIINSVESSCPCHSEAILMTKLSFISHQIHTLSVHLQDTSIYKYGFMWINVNIRLIFCLRFYVYYLYSAIYSYQLVVVVYSIIYISV